MTVAKKTLLDNIIESIKGIDGQLIKQSGTTKQMISDLNYKVVEPAKSAANSAQSAANAAIENSLVNSQAIDDINSAVSDATSDAAVARSDGLRAWNAAQSNVNLIDLNYASASASISSARTEALAAADEAKKSASAAQADIVVVKSSVAAVQADVTATKSDVVVAKSAIADTKTSLTSQANSLSSYAAQASANGADIVTLKSQAGQVEQDIASTKGDVSQLKASASSASVALSDAAGNISNLQATAKSFSAALSDTNSNVASVTATASSLETKYADAAGDINQIKADAKGTAETIANAQDDIAKLKTRADGFDAEFATANGNISKLQTDATGTTQTLANTKSDVAVLQSRADGLDAKYADAAGDINTLKANASGFSQTLTNAQGDISTLKSTVSGVQTTLTDAQGNISTLQSDVSGLKKTTSDNAGNIATLQANAQTLTNQMSGAQGDISTLKQTASDFSSKVSGMETSLADANGKINDIQANGGGRNLAIGTDIKKCDGPRSSADGGQVSLDTWKSLRGQWVTISCDMSWTGFTRNTKATNRIGYEVALGYSDGTVLYISNWYTPTDSEVNKSFRFSASWQLPDKELTAIDEGYLFNQIDAATCVTSKLMIERGTVAHDWSPAPEDTDAKITANTTAINQNKTAIALKADQTTVDKTNGTVQQLQSQLQVQAGQIATKVSSSDLDAKGYATQTYTQTQIKQTADSWNANLASVKDGLTQSYTNLHSTVDGIQAEVYNKDGSSKITQLSNLIATKVSQGDYNSQITQFQNDINLRVKSADLISQINLQAGTALIQSNKLVLDAGTTVVTGSAFIPDAAISEINTDKLFFSDTSGNKSFMSTNLGALDPMAPANSLSIRYKTGYEVTTSDRGVFFMMGQNYTRYAVRSKYSDNFSGIWASDTEAFFIEEGQGLHLWATGKDQSAWALYNSNNVGIRASLATTNAIEAGKVDDGYAYNTKMDTSPTAMTFYINGWEWVAGYVEAMGHSQHSILSAKTRIEQADPDHMLDLINQTELTTFAYKSELADGTDHRHIGPIIDDINDVAQYQIPSEFVAPTKTARDDGNIVGALIGAVQALTKRIKTLEEKTK